MYAYFIIFGIKNQGVQLYLPKQARFILSLYALGIGLFFILRLVLLLTNLDKAYLLPDGERTDLILNAFIMGFRFDNVISGYILCFPSLLLILFSFTKTAYSKLHWLIFYYCGVLYSIAFFACCADIPYFNHYFARLTTAVFNWGGVNGFIFNMILQEKTYFLYIILFTIVATAFWYVYTKYLRLILFAKDEFRFIRNLGFALLFIPLIFVSIRGRVEAKSPIRVGTAYFSTYAFPNQLGLNPLFTLVRSYLDDINNESQRIHFLNDDDALKKTVKYLKIKNASAGRDLKYALLSRRVNYSQSPAKANVVLILMESMSAEKMRLFGNRDCLTPNLDSLAKLSYSFKNFYTAGIHTYNGIFSTLYSFPALLKQHPMKVTNIPRMTGLPVTLKENGYSTAFFTTHDDQFDNMAGFMLSNGFDKIISQKDYPGEYIAGATGVPDHIMFEQSIPKLNSLDKKGKPFFAAYLTASDHGPYFIPDYIPFRPKSKGIRNQIIEYADWSLYRFMQLASEQKWFQNTIFIFVADHGAALDPLYDMPLSFHHSPFIIFSPRYVKKPKVYNQLCGQIDVYPVIMDLLKISYTNSTLGVNVLRDKRPYIYFSSDDKIGCINENHFLVIRMTGGESLYNYSGKSTTDIIDSNRALADDMKNYTFSMMQSSQIILQDLSSIRKHSIQLAFHQNTLLKSIPK